MYLIFNLKKTHLCDNISEGNTTEQFLVKKKNTQTMQLYIDNTKKIILPGKTDMGKM